MDCRWLSRAFVRCGSETGADTILHVAVDARSVGPDEQPPERQGWLPIRYKGIELHPGYRLDLVVAKRVLVEIKAVAQLLPVHQAQVITYLKLSGLPTGLLVNFHTTVIKHGLRRLTNKTKLSPFPSSCEPENT